jgi:hypothetical protein
VSEFDGIRSFGSSFAPSGRGSRELVEDEAGMEPADPPQREGLPPGYRMRAEPHYVEQLVSRVPLPPLRAIAIRDIDAPPREDDDIDALTQSVGRFGVLQPLLVRSRGGRFDLIAGRRRLAAAAAAGLADVPCLVYTCDDARARALAEADNLRPAPRMPVVDFDPQADVPPAGLEELRRSIGTIDSCLLLLAERETGLRDRVALDLVRTEVHRANRLVRCLDALANPPALSFSPHALRVVLDQALEAFAPERRLSGVAIQLEPIDTVPLVSIDAEWFGLALAAALGALFGIVQASRTPALHLRIAASASRTTATVELTQQVIPVTGTALARFFDAAWTDRPGGYQAAVELSAARAIVEQHRGAAEALAAPGGCRLVLTVPAA